MSERLPLRAHFPWMDTGDVVYLNAASTGPHPERAVAKGAEWLALRAQPQRITIPHMVNAAQHAREHFAAMIGADADEIALMPNTTYGLNLAARGLPLRPGTILTFDGEFPSCVYPFMALGSRGVSLERVPFAEDGLPDETELVRRIGRGDVVAVVVSWVQYASGFVTDLARVGAACRAAGAFFIVDGIQGVGVRPIDVHALGIDILASGAQKWMLSPWGTGFVYVRRDLHDTVRAPDVGWACMTASQDYAWLTHYDDTFLPDARRFEVVTLAYHDFGVAVEALQAMRDAGGPTALEAHIAALGDRIVAWAAERDDVRLWTPADRARRAGVFALVPDDLDAAMNRLKAAGVVCVPREGAVRLAPHGYNTLEDVERALAALGG
ncbi:MAG: aminotransferase class V-fold PLP-dependent enzyme [Gemmatimonadaceae bacterium]|nr:aminotransferase class V-fold PLP-dependent enzyme [Gemmatimonadaceae bacterium]